MRYVRYINPLLLFTLSKTREASTRFECFHSKKKKKNSLKLTRAQQPDMKSFWRVFTGEDHIVVTRQYWQFGFQFPDYSRRDEEVAIVSVRKIRMNVFLKITIMLIVDDKTRILPCLIFYKQKTKTFVHNKIK